MQFQVNTDSSIDGREALTDQVETMLQERFARYSDRLSRVEVHLSDGNGDRGGAVTNGA